MNYYDTFILVADDCPAEEGIVPTVKEGKSKPIHAIQYSLISENPYKLTQEDILFMVYAERNTMSENDTEARNQFFEKQQPCLRTSSLSKKYGWGVHFNTEGKAALVGKSSKEYEEFSNIKGVKIIKALRNKRAK